MRLCERLLVDDAVTRHCGWNNTILDLSHLAVTSLFLSVAVLLPSFCLLGVVH